MGRMKLCSEAGPTGQRGGQLRSSEPKFGQRECLPRRRRQVGVRQSKDAVLVGKMDKPTASRTVWGEENAGALSTLRRAS